MIKCNDAFCSEKAIIRFESDISKDQYCLDHLVERLEYIIHHEHYHLLKQVKKIIPIYSF